MIEDDYYYEDEDELIENIEPTEEEIDKYYEEQAEKYWENKI
jgi:hypothetical protein